MNRSSRILAGVDSSRASRDAFDYALAMSARYGAELTVVHAVPSDRPFRCHAGARVVLMEQLRQEAAQANVAFAKRVQSGDAAETILLHAQSLRADVIVVGTTQRSGIERLRAGSVAERVAAKATVPVLLVPQRRRSSATQRFRHIAVAVDFSPSSDRAIEQARAMATGPNDRITLIHVVPGFSSAVRPYLDGYAVVPYQDERIREARLRLRHAASVGRTSRIPIDTCVVPGDTTTEINRVVHSVGADVLIAGVPMRAALSRALFGTTAARLHRTVRVPLMAVPDTGRMVHAEGGETARRLAA
jgi:nucleotide-binding universal stress UspA family protein